MADETVEKRKSCQSEMWDRKVCGRPIHPAPEHDPEPVCLMHSQNPHKSEEEFQTEFERILALAKQENTEADFSEFRFPTSDYEGGIFEVDCEFSGAEFTGDANFYKATFKGDASFYGAKFMGDARFDWAIFTGNASFDGSTFKGNASFDLATLTGEAGFVGATFTEDASFDWAQLLKVASFGNVRFLKGVGFRETLFRHDETLEPGLWFTDVRLEHPESVEFYRTDLGKALFYNTDVSKIDFTLVDWRKRKNRYSLFEESVSLRKTKDLKPVAESGDERNYGLIAETYQQLKRNYDAKGDYWTAGHFHYGEMEMLRLHSRFRWKPLRWLARNLSLTALYKYASAYGESMGRPLAWLAAMVLLFALLFPLAGLEVNPKQGDVGIAGWQVNYWNAGQFFQRHPFENPVPFWARWVTRNHAVVPLLVHSGMTALSVAGFQKELRYSPTYPWGRALALLELLLTTTLGGLFLLAIRRQYKRS